MNWTTFLKAEKEKPYFQELVAQVQEDVKKHKIYPKREDLFNAFKYSPYDKTRCVIVGMDPYINEGQAHGLSFSVPKGVELPPSLRNIFKELRSDLGISSPSHGCLIEWAEQGVLLLNTYLTVRHGETGSHSKFGWQNLTDRAISILNEKETPVVFILWGAHAKAKRSLIINDHHLILQGAHPSPLSANKGGFFGGKYFSQCNDFLIAAGQEPINWKIESA